MGFVMNEEEKIQLLRSIFDVFNGREVLLWLESGLLLGLVRDNDFIPWDTDFDLGTSSKYLPKIGQLSDDLVKKGYSVYYSEFNNILAVWSQGWSVDIPFWRFKGDYAIMPLRYFSGRTGRMLYYLDWVVLTSPVSGYLSDKKNKLKFPFLRNGLCLVFSKIPDSWRISIARRLGWLARTLGQKRGLVKTPINFFEDRVSRELHGVLVTVPRDSEGYLEYVYGHDWKTPRKNFSYQNSGVEIRETESFDEEWVYIL